MKSVQLGSLLVRPSDPVVAACVSTVREAEIARTMKADLIEIRADLIPYDSFRTYETVFGISKAVRMSSIATIRRASDGGDWYRFTGTEEQRLGLFQRIMWLVDAVDIECDAPIRDEVIAIARKQGKTVIVSHHDYAITPETEEVSDKLAHLLTLGGDIVKLAYMALGDADCERLRHLLIDYTSDDKTTVPISVVTMGPFGSLGRVSFPWHGSCIAYGHVDKPLESGQVSVAHLKRIINLGWNEKLPILDNPAGAKALENIAASLAVV